MELPLPGRIGAAPRALDRRRRPPHASADDLTWVARARRWSAPCSPSVVRHRGALFLVALAAVVGGRRRRGCPRAGSGTPASCRSGTCSLRMLAAFAVAEVVRAVATAAARAGRARRAHRDRRGRPARRPRRWPSWSIGLPLRRPARRSRRRPTAVDGRDDHPVARAPDHRPQLRPRLGRRGTTPATSARPAWPEYRDLVDTMGAGRRATAAAVGRCWEYDPELDRYGTPMALMLLPYWTDGCIGSMEGLYFEASATTPYHFLNQSELSAAPSRPQRDLPYGPLDVGPRRRPPPAARRPVLPGRLGRGRGPGVGRAAGPHRGGHVRRRGTSTRWPTRRLVEPLDNEPAVVDGRRLARRRRGSTRPRPGTSTRPARDVPLAADGPDAWQRVGDGAEAVAEWSLPPAPAAAGRRCPTSRPTTTASPSTSTASGVPGAGEDVVLPELAGVRAPRARTGSRRT